MKLFVVCEMGTFGKRASRVFLDRNTAERFIRAQSSHLFKVEECPAPNGYVSPQELFAAHVLDKDYGIHRFSGLRTSNDEAKHLAGEEGLVLMLLPEA